LQTLEAVEPQLRLQLAFPLLKDSVRAVRIRAVGVIAGIPHSHLSAEQQKELDIASKEFLEVQNINADRPDAQLNLGIFYVNTGKYQEAESAYKKALQLQPSMIQAYVNLADLYRLEKAEDQGEAALKKALDLEPDNPEAHHALGLLLVREQRPREALPHFAAAAKHGSSNPHYSYVHALALNSAGRTAAALSLLKAAAEKFPANREILYGIISFARDAGDAGIARKYTDRLYHYFPDERSRSDAGS
jgi:tetratricopeptide (TPR) repeat protein